MTTMPLHTLLIPQGDFLWGATALSPGARSVAPRSPPPADPQPWKTVFCNGSKSAIFRSVRDPKNRPTKWLH
jgi:hypothetical protein